MLLYCYIIIIMLLYYYLSVVYSYYYFFPRREHQRALHGNHHAGIRSVVSLRTGQTPQLVHENSSSPRGISKRQGDSWAASFLTKKEILPKIQRVYLVIHHPGHWQMQGLLLRKSGCHPLPPCAPLRGSPAWAYSPCSIVRRKPSPRSERFPSMLQWTNFFAPGGTRRP